MRLPPVVSFALSRLRRGWAPVLLIGGLAACTPDVDQFAPACPQAGILPGGGDLTRWRGNGRDITDQVLQARVTGVKGECGRGSEGRLRATVSVQMTLNRGPAAPGRTADVTYFVAVAEGGQILDKQDYPLHVQFPPNTDRVDVTGDDVTLLLPVSQKKSGAAYTVWAGFQLTPQELQGNLAARQPPADAR
jgi:hypothetical protein